MWKMLESSEDYKKKYFFLNHNFIYVFGQGKNWMISSE